LLSAVYEGEKKCRNFVNRPYRMWKNVVNRDIISAISQNWSTSENTFWIDMTGYDFTFVSSALSVGQCELL
jgi:hypothetical protein